MSVADKIQLINTKLSSGKTMLADSITAKGVMASSSESLQSLAEKIATIEQGGGGEEELNDFGVRLTYPDRTTRTDVYNDGVVPASGYSRNRNIIFSDIGDGLTSIGKGAFSACTRLIDVKIGSGVTEINDSAFIGCSLLNQVVIPDSVKTIGMYAFSGGTNITSMTIGSGLMTIGTFALSSVANIRKLMCKPSVAPTLGSSSNFSSWGILFKPAGSDYSTWKTALPSGWTLYDGLMLTGDTTVRLTYTDNTTRTDSYPSDGIIPISGYSSATTIVSAEIGDEIWAVGDYSFWNCSKLESIKLPSGLKRIQPRGFYQCRALTGVTFPETLEYIGTYAFNGCTGLTSIVVPDSVKHIEAYAFENCLGLTTVSIGNGVQSFDTNTFNGCINLTAVTLGNGLKTIGTQVFNNCKVLQSIDIPASVTNIGQNAFKACTSLTSVTCRATTAPTLGTTPFSGAASNGTLYIPRGSNYSAWKSKLPSGWTITETDF